MKGWNVIGMFYEDISWREFKYCLFWNFSRKWEIVYSKSVFISDKKENHWIEYEITHIENKRCGRLGTNEYLLMCTFSVLLYVRKSVSVSMFCLFECKRVWRSVGVWRDIWEAMFLLTLITHFLLCIWIFLVCFSFLKCIYVCMFYQLKSWRYTRLLILRNSSWRRMDSVDRVGGVFCDMWDRDPTEKSCVYQPTAFKWRCHLFWPSNWIATMWSSSLSKYVYVKRNVCILFTASNQSFPIVYEVCLQ